MKSMQKRENSLLPKSTATRYAALKALVDIANHLDVDYPGKGVSPDSNFDWPKPLARALAHAQKLVDTPVRWRVNEDVPLRPTDGFYRDARTMRSNLLAIAESQHEDSQSRSFDLFTDTLRHALADCDWRRIRQCPECSHLFVAVPSDRTACSRACSSAQRVKKFLAGHPGYYARRERQHRKRRRTANRRLRNNTK